MSATLSNSKNHQYKKSLLVVRSGMDVFLLSVGADAPHHLVSLEVRDFVPFDFAQGPQDSIRFYQNKNHPPTLLVPRSPNVMGAKGDKSGALTPDPACGVEDPRSCRNHRFRQLRDN
jgi:hypothetical protein